MSEPSPPLVIAVDTGGTFTDFIALLPDGSQIAHKALSTPHDPGEAVLTGLRELLAKLESEGRLPAERSAIRFVHGSTVATNAILERKGAKTAFVATRGFKDLLHIGRQARRELYDLTPALPPPLVPAEACFEVEERVSADGEVVRPLEVGSVEALLEALREGGFQSVAVVFLHSYLRPDHEEAVATRLRGAGFAVSASHEILPEHREFERASTTVLNAYVSPLMSRYLNRLSGSIREEFGFSAMRVMQSNGGVTDAEHAGRHGVHTILSGPAGGVVGALKAAQRAGATRVITFDMGGTSTDVSLLPGELAHTTESEIEGYPVRIPVLDIHTVGAGGGSIAWVDEGGALRVGPQSAGAAPGPACYGRGGEHFTVTDANVVLNRLPGRWFMGGRMPIDRSAAEAACRRLATLLGASLEDAARAVLAVVNAQMERAVKVISVERGWDPRAFTLVAFGGAGALHGCELAGSLGIPSVLIPPNPGVLSSFGMAVADVVFTFSQALLGPLDPGRVAEAKRRAQALWQRAHEALAAEGVTEEHRKVSLAVDLRYRRQSYELTLPAPFLLHEPEEACLGRLAEAYHRAHEEAYGYAHRGEGVEFVAVRARAEGAIPRPSSAALEPGKAKPQPVERIAAYFGRERLETPVYLRSKLKAECELTGPAIVVEEHATTVVPPAHRCRVDPSGALWIS